MTSATLSSLDNLLRTLEHREPERVPLILMLTMHGAKELGMELHEYYARADCVAEGQLALQERYRHDVAVAFGYAAAEVEARGGDVVFRPNGPPVAGRPILSGPEDIRAMAQVDVQNTPCLARVLDSTRMLADAIGGQTLIVGVVMSPFSAPVMQLGFEAYLDLLHSGDPAFDRLMEVNQRFCIDWANAQLAAGANAICYFDPLSSTTMLPLEKLRQTGFPIARETIAEINGPAGIHLASGRVLPSVDDLADTGAGMLGVSALEDLCEVKAACADRLAVLGNLNAIELARCSPERAREMVKETIRKGAPGGGFLLSDNHGEIPYQVSDEVLRAVVEAGRDYGRYPIREDL